MALHINRDNQHHAHFSLLQSLNQHIFTWSQFTERNKADKDNPCYFTKSEINLCLYLFNKGNSLFLMSLGFPWAASHHRDNQLTQLFLPQEQGPSPTIPGEHQGLARLLAYKWSSSSKLFAMDQSRQKRSWGSEDVTAHECSCNTYIIFLTRPV